MRLGQTSAIKFASKMLVSMVGFLSTILFARVVGSQVLGTYFLLLSLTSSIIILVNAGIRGAITKRMSEGTKPGSYFLIGGMVIVLLFLLISSSIVVVSGWIQQYVGTPLAHVFLVGLIGGSTVMSLSNAGLSGSHNVHIVGILNAARTVVRVVLQVGALVLGFGLFGLVFGWIVGSIVAGTIGIAYVLLSLQITRESIPQESKSILLDLYQYAKFSWLGSIKAKTNNFADILILGLFVPNSLIGVYAVCWNIASFLTIFGAAVHETLFPEISRVTTEGDQEEIAKLVDQSLRYTGLFVIPGLFGGVILGPRILRLFGSEFVVGTAVLYILIIAVLLFEYKKQFNNALNGLDHPNLTFRVNMSFISTNIALNFGLVFLLGWIGAALATAISSGVGLVYSFVLVNRLVDVDIPVDEVGKQVAAALLMSVIVFSLLWVENNFSVIDSNYIVVGTLVTIGATAYMSTIMVISRETRAAIFRNLGVAN